ncbi:hypothetical protein H4R34_004617 [Dimargaris verticillata]|uniref:Mitochondrial zinc maintenance protein 1, mitochondrial n=1 Tax=Dimargaris verticillata TaxID=2761393 RepID=A0A9W8B275_9FUNG|nr:hypothetical protein H4R34_004617 [Dimargaris verticillata]
MVNSEAIAVFRQIARAGRVAFKGDREALQALRANLRQKYIEQRDETDPAKVAKNLKVGQQVAQILTHNVVQGVRKDSETFHLNLDKDRHEINTNPPIKRRET